MIRWRQPEDDAGIVKLIRKELVPISPRPAMRSGRLRQDIAARLRNGVTMVVSHTRRSEPFAFLLLQIRNKTLFIDLLAVDSSAQNRRWGSELMRRAEEYGYAQGCSEARLFVDETNHRGLRFYAKLGYSVVRHIGGGYCYELFKPLAVSWR